MPCTTVKCQDVWGGPLLGCCPSVSGWELDLETAPAVGVGAEEQLSWSRLQVLASTELLPGCVLIEGHGPRVRRGFWCLLWKLLDRDDLGYPC